MDDCFVFCNDMTEMEKLRRALTSKFEMQDLGEVKNCLGMRVTRDLEKGEIFLDQSQYIENSLKWFNMNDCKTSATPMEVL